MGRNVLLGFAGPGNVTHTTVKDLLKDYLSLGPENKDGLPGYPDGVDEIRILFPADDGWLTPTVKLLWEWADEYAEFPYEAFYTEETRKNAAILEGSEEAVEARNIAHALAERLVEGKKNGDEITLIVATGEGEDAGDANTEMLIDLALSKEIPIKDLTRALDDIDNLGDPEEESEPEQERPRRRRTAPEAPAAEEEQRPRRGKPRKAAETPSEPAEAVETESVEQEVSRARQKAQTATHVAGQPLPVGADVVLEALVNSLQLTQSLDAAHAVMTRKADREPCELTTLLLKAIDKYTAGGPLLPAEEAPAEAEPEEEKPRRTAGRRRADGSPAQPRSAKARGVKEWYDEDEGEWKKAGRGRLPRDVKVRTVDPKTNKVIED